MNLYELVCGILNELIYKTEIESQMWKTNLQLPGVREGRDKREGWGRGMHISTRHHFWATNKDLAESTGGLYPILCNGLQGKESKKGWR